MKSNILTENQKRVLAGIAENFFLAQNFYLTGGTALAAFYLHHRYSEDLDFFSEKEVDVLALDVFFKNSKKIFGYINIDFQQSYNRNLFFLHFPDEILKVEFTFFPFPRIEEGEKISGMSVDSILDIAVNKLFTIYQRVKARDYIDLYCMCKERNFSVRDLIKKAKVKFDWHIDSIQLGTQFMKAEEAKDFPRMIIDISNKEWHDFFIEEAKKLRGDILVSD